MDTNNYVKIFQSPSVVAAIIGLFGFVITGEYQSKQKDIENIVAQKQLDLEIQRHKNTLNVEWMKLVINKDTSDEERERLIEFLEDSNDQKIQSWAKTESLIYSNIRSCRKYARGEFLSAELLDRAKFNPVREAEKRVDSAKTFTILQPPSYADRTCRESVKLTSTTVRDQSHGSYISWSEDKENGSAMLACACETIRK
jgi:hypothetical protein